MYHLCGFDVGATPCGEAPLSGQIAIFTAYTVWIYCFGSVTMGAFNILTLTCRLGRYSERPSLSFFPEGPAG